MRHKWLLAVIILLAVVGVTFLFFNKGIDITGAISTTSEVDLLTFNYSAVTEFEGYPKVNVTGVIDGMCLLPGLPLWNKAGAGKAGGKIPIKVKGCPGTPMSVTGVQQYENTTWFKVNKHERKDGMDMWWEGWVTDRVILQGPLPVLAENQ